jgi:hypothetical protein
MDRSLELLHLAEAEKHVARGAKHIFDQELRVADIDDRGYDSALARDVLETFRLVQVQHLAHRDRILRVLNQQHRVSSEAGTHAAPLIEVHHAGPALTHLLPAQSRA